MWLHQTAWLRPEWGAVSGSGAGVPARHSLQDGTGLSPSLDRSTFRQHLSPGLERTAASFAPGRGSLFRARFPRATNVRCSPILSKSDRAIAGFASDPCLGCRSQLLRNHISLEHPNLALVVGSSVSIHRSRLEFLNARTFTDHRDRHGNMRVVRREGRPFPKGPHRMSTAA